MEKEFVTHDQAMRLKALGFDEDCLARYEGKIKHIEKPLVFEFTFANLPGAENKVGYPDYPYKDVEAPTFSQAFRWFREKYNKLSGIDHSFKGWYFVIREIGGTTDPMLKAVSGGDFKTYEDAERACLDKLIEIVESKSE